MAGPMSSGAPTRAAELIELNATISRQAEAIMRLSFQLAHARAAANTWEPSRANAIRRRDRLSSIVADTASEIQTADPA